MGKVRGPKEYLDSGDDNMPSEPNQIDAPGAQLLKDPGRTDEEHSNESYPCRAMDPDTDSMKDSGQESDILKDDDEYPHSEKKNPFADKLNKDRS